MRWQKACQRVTDLGVSLLQFYAGKAKQAEISLAIGEPEEDPAPEVIAAVVAKVQSPRHAGYTPAGGSQPLLEAVAIAFQEIGLPGIDVDRVLVSHGAKLLIDVALRTLCRPGDKVFWFAPGYTYGRAARENDRESVMIKTTASFDPDLEDLRSQLEKAKQEDRLGALVINNPVNPTGRVFSREILSELARIAKEYDMAVIADETYGGLVFPHAQFIPFASLSDAGDRTVTICSGSKEMRIPGYRFGYAAGPVEMISAMRIILGDCVGCPNVLTQAAALVALQHRRQYGIEQIPALIEKREMILKWCEQNDLPVGPIDGAYYAFVDFAPALARLGLEDTIQLAQRLLAEGVGIIPGDAFADQPGTFPTWARISIAGRREQLIEGLSRIGRVIGE